MKAVISLGVLVAASHAALAQPVTSPASCAVRVVRAPDDVKQVVETWVAAEPRCSVALDVRIIATDGGLYIFALDERGRIRERIVPDAQSAGVLVASWVADDTMYPAPAALKASSDPFENRQGSAEPELASPGMTISSEPVDGGATVKPTRMAKWVGVGLVLDKGADNGGYRADIDVYRVGRFMLGLAASATYMSTELSYPSGEGDMYTHDVKLMATASHTWLSGRSFLRASAGLGAVHTYAFVDASTYQGYTFSETSGWSGTAEASALVGREIFQNWSLSFGPVATIYAQNLHTTTTDPSLPTPMQGPMVARRDLEILFYTGLKYRL